MTFTNLIKKYGLFFGLLLVLPTFAQAQSDTSSADNNIAYLTILMVLILVIAILVLTIAVYLLYLIRYLVQSEQKTKEAASETATQPQPQENVWEKMQAKLTRAVPVEEEEKVLMDHEYDGIHELDNHLPPWWKWLFYISIAFSVVYLAIYHVFDLAPLSAEEYQIEMARAEEMAEARKLLAANSIDENNVSISSDPAALQNGEAIYLKNCAACHLNDGGGSIGPNLTDNYWIHGGSIQDIFSTIKYGVPDKGMISWQSQLSPKDMSDVSSYIMTLVGTTPAAAKEPQGELYEPTQENPDPSTETAPEKEDITVENESEAPINS
ncbi:MAG: cbb3-type cytochrome c oxidase N-terminal domain-containing protein [Candidatus Cyclobacteriaceae bacterium M3_2C_046]